jgi:hypothetical protein
MALCEKVGRQRAAVLRERGADPDNPVNGGQKQLEILQHNLAYRRTGFDHCVRLAQVLRIDRR